MRVWIHVILVISIMSTAGCATLSASDPAPMQLTPTQIADSLIEGNLITAVNQIKQYQLQDLSAEQAAQADLMLAYAHFRNLEQGQALASVNRFLNRNQGHHDTDYALYLKAEIVRNRRKSFIRKLIVHDDESVLDPSNQFDAQALYQRIVSEFPDSRFAVLAQTQLRDLERNHQLRQLKIASVHSDLGLWLASAKRLQAFLRDYPYSPLRLLAIERLSHNYRKMGLEELAKITQQIIELNRPHQALSMQPAAP